MLGWRARTGWQVARGLITVLGPGRRRRDDGGVGRSESRRGRLGAFGQAGVPGVAWVRWD